MPTTDSDDLASFGERVRRFRVERGLTQSQLAEQVALDRKTINRVEAGHYSTSLRTVFRIAAALSIMPGHLFTDDLTSAPSPSGDGFAGWETAEP